MPIVNNVLKYILIYPTVKSYILFWNENKKGLTLAFNLHDSEHIENPLS